MKPTVGVIVHNCVHSVYVSSQTNKLKWRFDICVRINILNIVYHAINTTVVTMQNQTILFNDKHFCKWKMLCVCVCVSQTVYRKRHKAWTTQSMENLYKPKHVWTVIVQIVKKKDYLNKNTNWWVHKNNFGDPPLCPKLFY